MLIQPIFNYARKLIYFAKLCYYVLTDHQEMLYNFNSNKVPFKPEKDKSEKKFGRKLI